ncbi:MAG: hypothetical protein M1827_003154 [Pycnora praestabilis]|nr:MAG: hypothetical protein M1827_003154 [Pycnora praestabilis]
MSFYHLRIIERLWGPRKFASFLLTIIPYTLLLPPLLLALILRPLTLNTLNHLPAGPSPILFALLAQYHAVIPHVYKYRISTTLSPSSSPSSRDTPSGVLLSDKTTTYVLAFQLALSQFPGSLIGAAVGWTVGYAWRAELLPFSAAKWRVPAWVVTGKSEGAGYEGLRRRLEGESEAAAAASGVEGRENAGEGRRRRTLGTQILDQFRGAF